MGLVTLTFEYQIWPLGSRIIFYVRRQLDGRTEAMLYSLQRQGHNNLYESVHNKILTMLNFTHTLERT